MPKYTINAGEKENRCLSIFYNRSNGTVLGRTPLDWIRLAIFYLVFYGVLGAFFFGQLSVVMNYIIKSDVPFRTGEDSLLKLTPGITLWPKLESTSNSIYSSTNQSSEQFQSYINTRKDALYKYFNNNSKLLIECDFQINKKSVDDVQRSCKFEKSLLGNCNDPETEMNRGNVCVYLKINRIFGYIPDLENKTFSDSILMKCEGQNTADIKHLGEPIYYPSTLAEDGKHYGKFSHVNFPYLNQPDYQDQLVAVTFPNITINTAVSVKCSLVNLKKESPAGNFNIFIKNQ